ncbi:hypothetical protein LMG18101_05093 [Ralstonia flaminis]|jgi:flagella basal body P-ring formation protein FlgA|uniref:Flagella basal body P-ring formation protein FlgA SAF domain-containing protein n=2 Tax=Ralstonia flaminis TaxID=3058597 RepID=A0ABM9KDD5_9RALS|nr:hypothetical protein LMG18101_05093 [Ralstonia sp. LMG 18101]
MIACAPLRLTRFVVAMLVVMGSVPTHVFADPGAHVALHEHVQVRRANVTLNDVAQLRARDVKTLRQLMALSIGPAPRPGESIVLDAKTIARFVQRRLELTGDAVEWDGAERVRIERAVQPLFGAQLQMTARQRLESWLRGRYERFSVSSGQNVDDISVPAGDVDLRVRELSDNQLPTPRMVVWVEVWVAGEFVRVVSVAFDVNVYQAAWVARHDVRAGDALRTADFERREIDVTKLGTAPVAAIPEGWRARHSVMAGAPLLEAAMQPIPVIARGQTVVLRSRVGMISLETRAEALQDGWPGRPVQVRMLAGRYPVRGQVMEDGAVELGQ